MCTSGSPSSPLQAAETPVREVQAAIERVAGKAAEWAALPATEKSSLLKQCLLRLRSRSDELVLAACMARGYDPCSSEHAHLVADAVLLTSTVSLWLKGGIDLLESLASTGHPSGGDHVATRPDGSWRVCFKPTHKKWFMGSCITEIVGRGEIRQYNPLDASPSVIGVLGAGNTEILNDIIDPLCRQNSVVVYKSNPVMELSNRVKEIILEPLTQRGYVAFVYGGVEVGKMIVESDSVDRIIMTGSHETYDKIIWGDRDKSDHSTKPVVTKPVQAELGSVNPYIVVPGDFAWTEADIEAQAEALVAYKLANNSHICAAPQVLVTCRRWPLRRAFLDAVRRKIAAMPRIKCFYPGTSERYKLHQLVMGGTSASASLLFKEDLQLPTFADSPVPDALREEAFCPVLYEVSLDLTPDLPSFLPAAVDFCQAKCWGNLSCMLVIDDATRENHQESLDSVLDSMRYGTIGINCPPSIANGFPHLPWGGFPGNSERDVQSGIGMLGNFCCYGGVEKSIMYGRFRNLLSFKLAQDRKEAQLARLRAEKIAGAFEKTSWWRILQLAFVELQSAKRHHTKRIIATRTSDRLCRRPAM
mmetsp:Transcript_79466/g.199741  ORF Transcript_79466/g.199741 Transcript_79466/m.199741 type:complete len:588 (+) Transcript_79466:58-1821(+)